MSQFDLLCRDRSFKRRRLSSFDKTGGNGDCFTLQSGTHTIAEAEGCGCIKHIWMTLTNVGGIEHNCLRKVVLKIYWDGCSHPSVQAPIGDFFGMGHAMSKNFVSAPLQMSPQGGKGFNSWWAMPFKKGFRVEIVNECVRPLNLFFYIDYELYDSAPDDLLYFHALWHRELTKGKNEAADCKDHRDWCFGGKNLKGEENYVILDAEGKGHYCGCNLNIHNLDTNGMWSWPGEGDDMIFIDGDEYPTLNGTGTEDYVNMAWCPNEEYCAPYHGLILGGKDNWKGKITYYRYHILDPISFERSIKVTIEHGHNNNRGDDWSSTAYWYQRELHAPFAEIAPVEARMPVDEKKLAWDGIAEFESVDRIS